MSVISAIKEFASVDIFEEGLNSDNFMGRPFYLDYNKAHLLVADSWKNRVKGLPHGTFLLAFYDNEEEISEALLLRVLRPTKLPTDSDVIASMIEFYKDKAGKYRWRIEADNGRILGASSQGFASKQKAQENMELVYMELLTHYRKSAI